MRHYAAHTQVLLVSVVFFCCPGLFSAFSSMAGGLQDVTLAFQGNVLIYVFFTFSSAIAAALVPSLGLRWSLSFGSIGYVTYALSLWNLSTFHGPLVVPTSMAIYWYYTASSVLGISAGFLWTAQGQMVMSYATEVNQGSYLSTFWIIFNLGAAGGGLLTCVLNWGTSEIDTEPHGISGATFMAYTALTAVGMVMAMTCIAPSSRVVKDNGHSVETTPSRLMATTTTHWSEDAKAFFKYVSSSKEILLLLPFFVYSNWFYTYHAFYNVAIFNTRTSGFASALYWTAQMLAAHLLGKYLDTSSTITTTQRYQDRYVVAHRVLRILVVVLNAMWLAGWYIQSGSLHLSYDAPLRLDIIHDAARAMAPLAVYIVYGAGDALGQVWIYWYLSSVCYSGRDLRIAGFNAGLYKSVHSLGAALAWYIGAQRVAPETQLATNWLLCNVGLVGAALSLRRLRAVGSTRDDGKGIALGFLPRHGKDKAPNYQTVG